MRIVHYYRDCANPSGVTHAIDEWQRATLDAGVDTLLLHDEQPVERDLPHQPVPHVGRGRHTSLPRLGGELRAGDVLVLHEGWVTPSHVAARTAGRKGVPYVVVPHGVYQPQILEGLKSPRLARFGMEQAYLSRAAAIHTFYAPEHTLAESVAGRPLRTIVAPTGFRSAKDAWRGGGGYLAWHGRYSPHHKGLDRLLTAYALTAPQQVPHLRLHGGDYQGGRALVEELVDERALGERVTIGPPIGGADKSDFLRRCDGYVFPSRWESHSISLLEALSTGAPVLLQEDLHASSWVIAAGAAIPTDFDDSRRAASALASLGAGVATGHRARDFVQDRLNWEVILPPYLSELYSISRTPA